MRRIQAIAELREAIAAERSAEKTVGFVATMGALHDGHLALVRAARSDCDVVVASIFINPTQFDRKSDFATYPRDEARDVEVAAGAGVDLLFTPSAEEMYPAGYGTYVHVEDLSELLCGAVRPGHFSGVATVVAKLLEIVGPDVAYFGEKDYQQLAIIKRMVVDLNMDVRVVGIPTVREAGGLALSSRNVLLSATEREAASVIHSSLAMAKSMIEKEPIEVADIEQRMRRVIGEEPLVRIEYLSVVDPESLKDLRKIDGPALIAIAAYVGDVRLIDNVTVNIGA